MYFPWYSFFFFSSFMHSSLSVYFLCRFIPFPFTCYLSSILTHIVSFLYFPFFSSIFRFFLISILHSHAMPLFSPQFLYLHFENCHDSSLFSLFIFSLFFPSFLSFLYDFSPSQRCTEGLFVFIFSSFLNIYTNELYYSSVFPLFLVSFLGPPVSHAHHHLLVFLLSSLNQVLVLLLFLSAFPLRLRVFLLPRLSILSAIRLCNAK